MRSSSGPLPARTEVLDERAAVVRALRHSPALAAARETVAAARARVAAAKTYPHDPVLGLEAGARQAGPATDLDLAVTVEQTLDLGGQRRARREAAEAVTAEALAAYEGARRSLVAQIRIAFVEVLRARAQAALAGTLAEMSTAQVVIVEKRLAVGDATRLDLNLARAEAGRAGADHAAARGVEAVAQALLATLVGADDPVALEVRGELTFVATAPVETAELRRLALTHRAELEATRQSLAAAQARVRTSEAAMVPDLDVGAFFRREGSEAHIFGGLVGVPLPVFGRARAEVDVARTELRRQTASAAETRQRIEQEVLVAAAERTAAVAAAQALERHVALALDENLRLLQRAYEAGEIGGSALDVARRAFRESGRELIEALAAAERARIRLELATGTLPVPPEDDVR